MCPSGPPLTTIDMSLSGQHSNFPQKQQPQHVAKNSSASVFDEEFCSFAFPGGSTYKYLLPSTQEAIFNAELVNIYAPEKESCVSLIKGQWTPEEDRELKKLVNDYGTQNWSRLAEKLDGRDARQCRERWFYHLQPGIKEGSWSEEEERILVKMHAKIGNRWSEIAKSIQGRTDSAIKNHWNGTISRQNSRKNYKRKICSNGKPQSCILENYIKRITPKSTTHNINTSTASLTTTPSSSASATHSHFSLAQSVPVTNEKSSSPLLARLDDEMLLVQNILKEPLVNVESYSLGYYQTNGDSNPNPNSQKMYFGESLIPTKTLIPSNNLDSDIHLSDFENGNNSSYVIQNQSMDLQMENQNSSEGNEDMDLTQLVCSALFFQ
ncbi:transcription factor MYB119-like [Gastrolobium bilobum]|uniref:transcription factor MYB119-like n=1 Tax=Gastrolobium bilobum TaxID=150636 RepID=UPI002AB1C42C|nr:transcription factor MYB119-like [Gastrolobium bilobum]